MKTKSKDAGSKIAKGKKASHRTGEELSEKELAGVRGGGRAPISGGVLNGKAISLPKPAYPPIA